MWYGDGLLLPINKIKRAFKEEFKMNQVSVWVATIDVYGSQDLIEMWRNSEITRFVFSVFQLFRLRVRWHSRWKFVLCKDKKSKD